MCSCFVGAVGGDGGGDDGDDKEKAEEEERERQEAIKEAEDRRKEKHRKMEEEREKMRQEIRDKVSESDYTFLMPMRCRRRIPVGMFDDSPELIQLFSQVDTSLAAWPSFNSRVNEG